MTSAHLVPGAAVSPLRPSNPRRRALGFEVRHHWDVLAFHGVLATILIVLAQHIHVTMGVVLILLAARLPADLADQVREEGRMLRSSLGISRADAVRARTLVILAGQLLLAAGTAWIILITDHAPGYTHWSAIDISPVGSGPSPLTLKDHLVDIGLWSGAIIWTHALIGGEAFRLGRRPTGRRAIALFLGVCLVTYLALWISALLTNYALMTAGVDEIGGSRSGAAATTAQILALVLTTGGGIAALLMARRRWIRRA